eukprot:CAMPEP_0170490236 /NCGR_PEP_ID=MMETSP0208-20121228/8473_1 /TAXON_ID=197538 /ORGANISM="Strombidium inclinatum, Strain S3" /LENGTH=55 /DNA_ID=CAMNT_0010765531 /DNA_START=36 /DNA_END=203 /DNA_ORIENTATION=-
MAQIKVKYPDMFDIKMFKDNFVTGNFEVTLFENGADLDGEGVVIHSRRKSGLFPA